MPIALVLTALTALAALAALALVWAYASPAAVRGLMIALSVLAALAAAALVARNPAAAAALVSPRALAALAAATLLVWALYTYGRELLTPYVEAYGAYALLALLTAGALGVVWLQFGRLLGAQTGLAGLAVHLLFAAPCLLAWGARYLANDFQGTARPTLLLLAAEAALIAAYALYPRAAAAARAAAKRLGVAVDATETSVFVPREPSVYLNYETRLAGRRVPAVLLSSPDLGLRRSLEYREFRLAFELFLYPHELGRDAALPPLLRYAQSTADRGAPAFYWAGQQSRAANNTRNEPQIKVFLTNRGNDPAVFLPVPTQKWIAVVAYYTSERVDLALDGHIVHSLPLTEANQPVFNAERDRFVLGSPRGDAVGSLRMLTVTSIAAGTSEGPAGAVFPKPT